MRSLDCSERIRCCVVDQGHGNRTSAKFQAAYVSSRDPREKERLARATSMSPNLLPLKFAFIPEDRHFYSNPRLSNRVMLPVVAIPTRFARALVFPKE